MLSYAFRALNQKGYERLGTESFRNIEDLCAGILILGLNYQLKRGFSRDYVLITDDIPSIKGKINISDSIKNSIFKGKLTCSYDEFSMNSNMNRIIKTTMECLLHDDIDQERKHNLRNLLVFFKEVGTLDVNCINWNLKYDRNNQTYMLLINICYLYIKRLNALKIDGKAKLWAFSEEHMNMLYEKFILGFYQRHYPDLSPKAPQIDWFLNEGEGEMLPIMQADTMLRKGNKCLIVDAKYYRKITQEHYDVKKWHSNNLYQIFTYVKNKEAEMSNVPGHAVSGMLLYAKTDEDINPVDYMMSGNKISIRTLDLNYDFNLIKDQLVKIAEDFKREDILISIKPEYVEKIISGEKKFEYRTRIANRSIGKMYIYESTTTKKVVAEAEILEVLAMKPSELWEKTNTQSGTTKSFFMSYFKGKEVAYAYKLGRVTVYRRPMELSAFGLKSAPQSFVYLSY